MPCPQDTVTYLPCHHPVCQRPYTAASADNPLHLRHAKHGCSARIHTRRGLGTVWDIDGHDPCDALKLNDLSATAGNTAGGRPGQEGGAANFVCGEQFTPVGPAETKIEEALLQSRINENKEARSPAEGS